MQTSVYNFMLMGLLNECRLCCGPVCLDVFRFKNHCVGSRAKPFSYAAVFQPVSLNKCEIPSLLSKAKLRGWFIRPLLFTLLSSHVRVTYIVMSSQNPHDSEL